MHVGIDVDAVAAMYVGTDVDDDNDWAGRRGQCGHIVI